MPYSKLAREHMWIYLLLMCFNSGSPKATTEKISIFDMCYFQILRSEKLKAKHVQKQMKTREVRRI